MRSHELKFSSHVHWQSWTGAGRAWLGDMDGLRDAHLVEEIWTPWSNCRIVPLKGKEAVYENSDVYKSMT
jgi:hypothetical protein